MDARKLGFVDVQCCVHLSMQDAKDRHSVRMKTIIDDLLLHTKGSHIQANFLLQATNARILAQLRQRSAYRTHICATLRSSPLLARVMRDRFEVEPGFRLENNSPLRADIGLGVSPRRCISSALRKI
jgi:hypothetical protein